MNKNNLKELSRICSNNSILVINTIGIYRLFTPFKVVCIVCIEMFEVGDVLEVNAVKMSSDYKLVYIIKDKGYYHHYFIITAKPKAIHTGFN